MTQLLFSVVLLRLVVLLSDEFYLVDEFSVVQCIEAVGGQRSLLFAAESLHGVEMLEQEETGIGVGGIETERALVLRRIRVDILVERVAFPTVSTQRGRRR